MNLGHPAGKWHFHSRAKETKADGYQAIKLEWHMEKRRLVETGLVDDGP